MGAATRLREAAASGSAAGVSITDSFNRADNASSLGTADTGQTWTAESGTWGISTNTAYSSTASQATAVIDSGIANATIQVTISTAGDAGLCWRSSGPSDHFVSTNTAVYREVAGAFTAMGSYGVTIASGDVVTVIVTGTSHTVKINGVTKVTFTDSFNSTVTKHGLRSNAAAARFDTFSIVS